MNVIFISIAKLEPQLPALREWFGTGSQMLTNLIRTGKMPKEEYDAILDDLCQPTFAEHGESKVAAREAWQALEGPVQVEVEMLPPANARPLPIPMSPTTEPQP